MTPEEFQHLVREIGRHLGIVPDFSFDGEVARIGDDELELHRSGIVRRCRYLYREPVAGNIANSIRLHQADRCGPYMRRPPSNAPGNG